MSEVVPLVSALVSSYKAEAFILRCLENLLAQSLGERLEIVLINSGSPEREHELIQPLLKQQANIVYIKTEREPLYSAWNRGIRAAKGRYLISANTDDQSHPDAFAIQAELLDTYPAYALVYTDYYCTTNPEDVFSERKQSHWHTITAPSYSHKELLLQCFCGPRPMWRRALHEELGYFDESLQYAGDYEFWLRIAEKYPMLAENTPLHLYFDNPQGLYNSHRRSNEELQVRARYLAKGRQ